MSLPDNLSVTEASTLPCAALTAWNAVIEHSPLVPGQRVLVFGSGGVSVFALQFARLAGAEVWAMTRRAERTEQLIRFGAHRVIIADSVETMSRQLESEGKLVDTIIDVVGGDLNPQARILAPGGRLAALGCAGSMTNSIDHRFMPMQIDTVSVGSREMFFRMLRATECHEVRPAIDRVFPFGKAVDAFRYLADGRSFGKVVIRLAETA